jgi:hypothetical protein
MKPSKRNLNQSSTPSCKRFTKPLEDNQEELDSQEELVSQEEPDSQEELDSQEQVAHQDQLSMKLTDL